MLKNFRYSDPVSQNVEGEFASFIAVFGVLTFYLTATVHFRLFIRLLWQ